MFDFLFNGGFMFILIIAGIAVFLNFVPLALWISAIAAGVNVGIFNLVGMRFRRVPASQIVLPLIKANKAGLDVNVNQLEAHYLVGGAGEATIIARVGEGIVTNVGSAVKHSDVLENPDFISRTVLAKGLDAGTAFEILSIDIADVDVGRNIGAALMTDQAEADKRIAQARAEERRAMAVAKEQEMKAYTQEMQAKVVEAQAKVPTALADALENGRLGVMDYYRMNNINADTDMRKMIAGSSPENSGEKGSNPK